MLITTSLPPEYADEVRPAAVDTFQANIEYLLLLLRDTPSEVDLTPGDPLLLADRPENWKDWVVNLFRSANISRKVDETKTKSRFPADCTGS